MLIYERLYPSRYESKLYSSRYKRDKGGDDNVLIMVWLEAKNDLILGLRDRYVTMALHFYIIGKINSNLNVNSYSTSRETKPLEAAPEVQSLLGAGHALGF